MVKLGVNSVLFKNQSFSEAARLISMAGYDGVEISAIKGMCEHLELDNWHTQVAVLRKAVRDTGLEFLSTEVASLVEERLLKAFEACAEIGIPVVNIGPGGRSESEEDLLSSIEQIAKLSEKAKSFGVTLCVKAHVGAAIYNTPTTLRAIKSIYSEGFGIDMDPSHIYRAGENPQEALSKVISHVKHIHIRDCKGRGPSPGQPALQTCGRGDIDLYGYCKAMTDNGYSGPVCLEVIGPDIELAQAVTIAAESYGYLNACLKCLGAR
ncbi:MAG: sugar phosphate isomerase/epimerase [Clostridiales bacterium]|nr:sugar phosphate isomerase/epimerase [Clostridiales bacterium]